VTWDAAMTGCAVFLTKALEAVEGLRIQGLSLSATSVVAVSYRKASMIWKWSQCAPGLSCREWREALTGALFLSAPVVVSVMDISSTSSGTEASCGRVAGVLTCATFRAFIAQCLNG